jgi:hypothetical protein
MVIDSATNEMRFYGDRGDGTIEEMASVGIASSYGDTTSGSFGSSNGLGTGVIGRTGSNAGVSGVSSGLGVGTAGTSSSGNGGKFDGNPTSGNLLLLNANGSTFPTNKATNQLTQVGGRLYYADGSNWLPLTQPYFESSELTMTNNALTTANHGLGFVPKRVECFIRCKTAELNWSVGDEINIANSECTTGSGLRFDCVYADATVVGISFASTTIPDKTSPAARNAPTNANWKFVLRAL